MKDSPFLQGIHHAYAQTHGGYAWPNSREGDLLREAAREIAQLQARIDALMLEYCPEDMADAQRGRWATAQSLTQGTPAKHSTVRQLTAVCGRDSKYDVQEKCQMNKPQEDRVVLTLQVRAVTDDLRKEDREIPGDYLFSVSNALPEDQRASAVLDSFHAHLPVGILDDFEFAVWYQGRLLEERDDHEEYSLQHAALLESFRSLKPEDRGARPVTEMSDGMRRSICFSAANSIQDFLNGGWDGNEEGWRVILARLRQAAGPGVEQTPDQKDTPDSIAYILIQEGGTSRELYLHGWETQEEAEQDRVNCAEHGAYRTGPVITAPKSLESHPEFYTVVEKVLGSLQDLDFGVALAEAPDDGSENNPGLRRAPAAPKF